MRALYCTNSYSNLWSFGTRSRVFNHSNPGARVGANEIDGHRLMVIQFFKSETPHGEEKQRDEVTRKVTLFDWLVLVLGETNWLRLCGARRISDWEDAAWWSRRIGGGGECGGGGFSSGTSYSISNGSKAGAKHLLRLPLYRSRIKDHKFGVAISR